MDCVNDAPRELEMNQDTKGGYSCLLASSAPQPGGCRKRSEVVITHL